MTRVRVVAIVLLSVVAIAGTYQLWTLARSTAGMDFYQMWVGARGAREFDDFYSDETRRVMGEMFLQRAQVEEQSIRRFVVAQYRRDLETVSTPLLYAVYAPFRGNYERDFLLFQLVVFAAFAGWLTLLLRMWSYTALVGLLLYCALAFAFAPVLSDLRVGNMNHVILLLLAASMWLLRKRELALGGAVIAVATLTKPYTVLVLPLLVLFCMVQRRWKDAGAIAGGAIASAATAFALSSLHFRDWYVWPSWYRDFRNIPDEMVPISIGNFALVRVIRELSGGIDVSIPQLLVLSALAVIAARRTRPSHGEPALVALGCIIFQLGSPLVWLHHLLLALPLVTWLLRPQSGTEAARDVKRRQLAAGAAFILLAVSPWEWMLPSEIQVAAMANVGLVILYGAALFDVTRDASRELIDSDGAPRFMCRMRNEK